MAQEIANVKHIRFAKKRDAAFALFIILAVKGNF
jgi:hypothetical protein